MLIGLIFRGVAFEFQLPGHAIAPAILGSAPFFGGSLLAATFSQAWWSGR
ncbi:hypothetical protein LNP20_07065 [Klebsiella pneumoniae subsp. pneumoniae]|nr:hypothetical protein [Klebsiella pneumoniae subsp. pneumoniae]